MEFEELYKLAGAFEGWLTKKEAALLWMLAKKCSGKGVILEIGSWKGKSTSFLGQGAKGGSGVKVYAVDPHTGTSTHAGSGASSTLSEFKRNIASAEAEDSIVPIVKTSQQAAADFSEPVELCFIDGNHDFESVQQDITLWFPKIINGGFVAFHDSVTPLYPGVAEAVDKYVFRSGHFKNISFIDSITFAEKTKCTTLLDRARNRYVLFLRNCYTGKIRSFFPKPFRKLARKIIARINLT
jgi:predicted O-methyltransferase YrrM